jgi:hypothetical protein
VWGLEGSTEQSDSAVLARDRPEAAHDHRGAKSARSNNR